MALSLNVLHNLIAKAFPEAIIELNDFAGDENHYELIITTARFNTLSLIEQHRLVYAAIGDFMGNELHALKINTKKDE